MNLGGQNFTFTMSDGPYFISNKILRICQLERDQWLCEVLQKHESYIIILIHAHLFHGA